MEDGAKRLLATLWGKSRGYVFISTIRWHGGKYTFEGDKAFMWPTERHALSAHVDEAVARGTDVYFTPGQFSKPERRTEFAKSTPLIWADVDDAPIGNVRKTRPTALWETSPGRFQAIWKLQQYSGHADDEPSLARGASRLLHCDPSGWDATQLLRLPGTVSHKRSEPFKVGSPELLPSQAVRRFIHRVYSTLPFKQPYFSSILRASDPIGDRSGVLFDLVKHLLTSGMEQDDAASLLRWSIWNRWTEPADLVRDIARIAKRLDVQEATPEQADATVVEELEPRAHLTVTRLTDFTTATRPNWIVKGLVERKSCGYIAGPPKQFKSWVMLDMALAVASGKRCLDHFGTKQAPVLLVEAEDNAARLASRLDIVTHRAGWQELNPRGYMRWNGRTLELHPPKGVPLYIITQPPLMFGGDFYEDLIGIIQEYGIKLCLYDTLSMLSTEELNSSRDMYNTVLRPLKAIANEYDAAQLLVHHTRKATQGVTSFGGAALAGSVGLHAWSDNSLYMRKEENKVIIETESKSDAPHTHIMTGVFSARTWTPIIDAPEEAQDNEAGDFDVTQVTGH